MSGLNSVFQYWPKGAGLSMLKSQLGEYGVPPRCPKPQNVTLPLPSDICPTPPLVQRSTPSHPTGWILSPSHTLRCPVLRADRVLQCFPPSGDPFMPIQLTPPDPQRFLPWAAHCRTRMVSFRKCLLNHNTWLMQVMDALHPNGQHAKIWFSANVC